MPYVVPQPTASPMSIAQQPSSMPSSLSSPSLKRTQSSEILVFPSYDHRHNVGSSSTTVPFPSLSPRKKRVRGVRHQSWTRTPSDSSDSEAETQRRHSVQPILVAPPAPPAPTVTKLPPLRIETRPRRTYSESHIIAGSGACIFKKNGEPLKSALKSPMTPRTPKSSMPNTPSFERIVHFDAQLEYVRLFNKEQKPAAVSRDGSPFNSDDESDRRPQFLVNDVPCYLGSSEDERVRRDLVLESVNMPLRNALAQPLEILGDSDVRIETAQLTSGGRSIQGTILVRNLAFEKWLAIRFTFDWWQTTSEVMAKYKESLEDGQVDRFEYNLRLPDITAKIEEKRLFMAARYLAAGRESWDNNRGENYQFKFKHVAVIESGPSSPTSRHPPSWPVKSANKDQMADLRKELERVVREEESGSNNAVQPAPRLRPKAPSFTETTAQSSLSLKRRYDFSVSAKVQWTAPTDLPKPRTNSLPDSFSAPFSTNRAALARGSPRDPDMGHTPKFFIDPKDADHWGRTPSPAVRTRHHQRGGYFDSWMESTVPSLRLTPTTGTQTTDPPAVSLAPAADIVDASDSDSTTSSSASSATEDAHVISKPMDRSAMRFNSYPMDRSHLSPATPSWGLETISPPGSSSSIASTPSFTSASTPSQSPSSPSDSFTGERPSLESIDYNYFLSRFCYFTGSDVATAETTIQPHVRRHSAESVVNNNDSFGIPRLNTVDHGIVVAEPVDYLGSGDATPTRSTTPKLFPDLTPLKTFDSGLVTPRAGSPISTDVERTPRQAFDGFVRPHRGSL